MISIFSFIVYVQEYKFKTKYMLIEIAIKYELFIQPLEIIYKNLLNLIYCKVFHLFLSKTC